MTQLSLFTQQQVGNLIFERPWAVGRVTFAPLPDMRGQPPAQNVPTSLEAADRIHALPKTKQSEADLLSWLIYRCMPGTPVGCFGATDDEIGTHFVWDGDYTRPRRWTLRKKMLIRSSDLRRKTKDGNNAIVWVTA